MTGKCPKCGYQNKIEELINEFPDQKDFILREIEKKKLESNSLREMARKSTVKRKLMGLI